MIWYEKLKSLDFNDVKNIAKKYGKNKIIAEQKYRELAVKFAIAIEEGKSEYKKNNLKKNLIQPY